MISSGTTSTPPASRSDFPTLGRGAAWTIAGAATLTMAVSYVDRQALAALAPIVTRDLAIGDTSYGLVQSVFSLAYLVGAPLAGAWIDRVGARRGLVAALLAWSIVAAAHAQVAGLAALVALRVALGLAEAPSFPGAAQTVQRVLPPRDRAVGFGVLFTGSSIGALVAPIVALRLEARFGWRGAFVGTALVGLAWVPLWLAVTRGRAARAALDVKPAPAARRAGGALAALAEPAVLRATCVVVAASPVIAFFLLWSSKLYVARFGLPARALAPYLVVGPVLFDLGSVAFGAAASRLARRHGGPPRALVAGAAALTAACALEPLAADAWTATAIAGLSLAGGGGLFALATADMLARVPADRTAGASGITAAAQSIAYVVANPLIGLAVERSGGYGVALVALAAWVVPGCAAWLLWPAPPRAEG